MLTVSSNTYNTLALILSLHSNIIFLGQFICVFTVSSQLISNIISQLMGTTNSVMQLHQRLKSSDESSNGTDNRKQEMIKELENAVMMTQTMLTKITSSNK